MSGGLRLTMIIAPLVLALSCAAPPTAPPITSSQKSDSIALASQTLDCPAFSVRHVGSGYLTDARLAPRLDRLAGLYAGTIKLIRTSYGHMAVGSYSHEKHPRAYHSVLNACDLDKDKVITGSEISSIEEKFIGAFGSWYKH